jgi:type III secretion protein H
MMIPPLSPPAMPRQEPERLMATTPGALPRPGEVTESAREAMWQRYRAANSPDPALIAELVAPVKAAVLERFGQCKGAVVPAIDLPELRRLLREFDPLGKRQETVLLELLKSFSGERAVPLSGSDVQGVSQGEAGGYLRELVSKELMTLMPRNSMVDNLLRNSHPIDLEG